MRDILIAPLPSGKYGFIIGHLDTAIRMVCAFILWITFLTMFLPTFGNAVLRYTTNDSLTWSVEIVQLTFPWFIMGGAVLAAQHGRHIGVEAFISIASKHLTRFITIPVQVLILLTCGTIIYVYLGFGQFEGGMKFAANDVAFTSLGVPQSWSYLALLIGYIMLGLTAISTIYRLWFDDQSRIEQNLSNMIDNNEEGK